MKKIILGTVGLIAAGLATPASAADIAARPYTKAPPMIAAIYNWSGFYIGGNGGYGTSRKCWDMVSFGVPGGGVVVNTPPVPAGCHDADGATAGGQIGYRWQAGQFVYGLEGQGNWADFRGSNIAATAIPAGSLVNRSRVDAFGLITGQVGYAWNNVLLYAKGGAAVVANRYRIEASGAVAGLPAGTPVGSANDGSRWGAAAGAGLEVGFAPNWSAGVEYNRIFTGTQTVNFTSSGAVLPAGALTASERIRGDIDTVTARINYRWGGPVVARY